MFWLIFDRKNAQRSTNLYFPIALPRYQYIIKRKTVNVTATQVFFCVISISNNCLIGNRMDLNSAFRLLPIHPSDFCLLGIKFRDYYFFTNEFLSLMHGHARYLKIFQNFCTRNLAILHLSLPWWFSVCWSKCFKRVRQIDAAI